MERILEFAEILRLDQSAIMAAFFLRKPQIAHDFALNKFMLVQASAVDELDTDTRNALAAVDSLTVLDAHLQFFTQLAEYGRLQLQAGDGIRTHVKNRGGPAAHGQPAARPQALNAQLGRDAGFRRLVGGWASWLCK